MSKPLVFVKNRVKIEKIGKEVDSWDLLAFGDCPIMHAAWNPMEQMLVVQFNSVKENLVDIPRASKTGKVTMNQSRAEQYYRVTISDKSAVQFILDNYVSNYDGQEWELSDQVDEGNEAVTTLKTV